jgi:hypothetical protein
MQEGRQAFHDTQNANSTEEPHVEHDHQEDGPGNSGTSIVESLLQGH